MRSIIAKKIETNSTANSTPRCRSRSYTCHQIMDREKIMELVSCFITFDGYWRGVSKITALLTPKVTKDLCRHTKPYLYKEEDRGRVTRGSDEQSSAQRTWTKNRPQAATQSAKDFPWYLEYFRLHILQTTTWMTPSRGVTRRGRIRFLICEVPVYFFLSRMVYI